LLSVFIHQARHPKPYQIIHLRNGYFCCFNYGVTRNVNRYKIIRIAQVGLAATVWTFNRKLHASYLGRDTVYPVVRYDFCTISGHVRE